MGPVSWWSKHAGIDYIVAGGAAGALWVAHNHLDPIVVLDGAGRANLYGSLTEVAMGILAFAVVPAAIILALTPGPRLRVLLEEHPGDLRIATIHAAGASVFLMVAVIAGQSLDVQASNSPVRYLIVVGTTTSVLGALRLVDLFSILLRNVGRDRGDGEGKGNPLAPIEQPAPPEGVSSRVVSPVRGPRRRQRLHART